MYYEGIPSIYDLIKIHELVVITMEIAFFPASYIYLKETMASKIYFTFTQRSHWIKHEGENALNNKVRD